MSELQSLVNKLTLANQAYAMGQPFMSEEEYHDLWRSIHAIDPYNDALYHTGRDPHDGPHLRRHPLKIMGTQKAFETRELKPFLTRYQGKPLILEPKYDGVAAMIYPAPPGHSYPYLAILEGDSEKGRDISHHIPYIDMPPLSGPRHSVELLIPWSRWSPEYGANPRNVCAGWINSTSKVQDHPNVIRAILHNGGPLRHGLPCPSTDSLEEFELLLMQLFDEWKAHYPLDGIMIKLADSRDRLRASHNGVISNWSVAWKPPIQTEETRVTDIELNVSRHGSLVPTLIYEPVNLCGTTNTKVTANNMTWLLHQGIDISSRIVIGKAGEIIPQVVRVLDKRRPSIPSECPMCGGPLEWAGVHLTCVSSDCVAKTHEQLTHFYGHYGIDVPGIGPGRIESLLNYPTMLKMLRSSPWALLDPRAFALMDILQFVWGQKRFESYLDGLDQIQKTTTVVHFISALGYPSLGYKTALRLLQEMRGYTIKSGVRGSKEGLNSFVLALNDLQRASQELVNFEFQPVPPPPKLIYTITGTLSMPRQELITYLEKFDWQFVPRHSSNIDLLIVGDTNKVTTKLRVAQEHGTPQVLEHELPEWLPPTTEEENKNAANKPSKADGRD